MSINTHRLSRSKTPEVSITKRAWDERFCLAKIPVLPLSNSPFKTRKAFHMSRNSASNISSISMTRIQSRPDTSATNSTPVRSRSHKRLPINDVFVTAKIKLEEMWDKKMIPDGLRLAFKECIYTLPQYKSLSIMAKETEDLKTHNSLVQIAIKTVEEREKLLIQIQDLITAFNLAQENETTKDLQLEAAETLQTYRVISLNVVESIARWREQLVYAQLIGVTRDAIHPRTVQFMWKGRNYLIKMRTDTNFISKSVLAAFFRFSNDPDPFLIQPSQVSGQKKTSKIIKEQHYYKKNGDLVIPLASVLLKRLRIAEMLIMEEVFNDLRSNSMTSLRNNSTSISYRESEDIISANNELVTSIFDDLNRESTKRLVIEFYKEHMKEKFCEYIYDELLTVEIGHFSNEILKDEMLKNQISDCVCDELIEKLTLGCIEKWFSKDVNYKKEIEMMNKKEKMKISDENLKKNAVELVYADLLEENIRKLVEDTIDREMKVLDDYKESSKSEISVKICEDLLTILLENLTETEIKSEKLSKKQEDAENEEITKLKINEKIIYDYVDEIIEGLVQKEIHREHKSQKQKINQVEKINNKVAKRILSDIIHIFIKMNYKIRDLSEQWLLEEIEDSDSGNQDLGSELSLLSARSDSKSPLDIVTNDAIEKLTNMIFDEIFQSTEAFKNELLDSAESLDSNTEPTPREDEEDYLSLHFATDETFRNIDNLDYTPTKIPENLLQNYLKDYYRYVPRIFEYFIPSVSLLLTEEMVKGVDPNVLWIKKSRSIIGLLVVSIDSDCSQARKLTIHHISCLNHDYFQLVLDKSLDFLWESYPVDEIRIHIFNEKHGETKDIPKELKNTLNSFQFRYKAQITTSSGMSTIMGKPRPERKLCRNYKLNQFDMEIQCLSQLNLHVKNNIILSKHEGIKEPTPVPMRYMNTAGGNEETLLIDNKFSIVVSLLKLCDEIIPGFGSSSTHHNRFSDLLEEVGSLDQFTVEMADILIPENKTQITNFIEKYTINKTTIFKKPSIIVLQNMRFSWSACSHITLAIEYENFKFLRFQYNLKHYSSDLGSIFIVPTTNSKINTFYIKINTMKHTDVFYYVQEFMKISKDCYKEISELWVPQFSKTEGFAVPWLENYSFTDNQTPKIVQNCTQNVEVSISPHLVYQGSISNSPEYIIHERFIFGKRYLGLIQVNNYPIPSFITIVDKSNWVLD